jgi:hypothetical protein
VKQLNFKDDKMNIKKTTRISILLIGFLFVGLASAEQRSLFDVDFNLGWQLDRFTASDLSNALDPEDSGDTSQSALLDIRVNYQLRDSLWLYGNTARTIRSTAIICNDSPSFIGCDGYDDASDPDLPSADTAFSILRDAESLEAHVGLRYEFGKINNTEAPGQFYISKQLGFASVTDTDDLAEINQIALGIVITDEKFKNSFVEFGEGKNELYPSGSSDRTIFRIHLEYSFMEGFLGFSDVVGFLETEVDFDSSKGSDSVRTKIGFELPIGT